jgi:branched-chain amino acid transport system permease protein
MSELHYSIANDVLFFIMLALSLNLLMGYLGLLSVAQASFAGIGAYTVAKLTIDQDFTFFPAVIVGTLFATIAGVLIALPAIRLKLEHLILLTLAFAIVLVSVANGIPELGGLYGLLGIPFPEIFGKTIIQPSEYFWLFLVVGLVIFFVYWRMGESPYGRVLKAIREDEIAARSLGKNAFSYKLQVSAVTSAMAGLAGCLLAYYQQLVTPQTYAVNASLLAVTMVIFGGMGSLFGPVVGAVAIVISTPILEKIFDVDPEKASLIRLIAYGIAIILIIRLRPQGIIPEGASLTRFSRRMWARVSGGVTAPAPQLAHATASPGGALAEESTARLSGAMHSDGAPAAPAAPAASGNGAARDGMTVKVEGLSKRFGGIVAADNVQIELPAHQITGLVGPNGAGKTTLFSLLTGMLPRDSGYVQLYGQDVTEVRMDLIARRGMVRSFQDVRLFLKLSAIDNVMVGFQGHPGESLFGLFFRPIATWRTERHNRVRAMELLRFVGLADRAEYPAGALAFGDQKLLAIARLLATDASVMLLDEPTSGIDPQWVENVAGVVRALPSMGKTVCIVEHNLHALERVVDRCYFMEYGKITGEGTLQSLMDEPRLQEAYFGS